jgi:metal-responsive CopG/Arc/MetJ family transcriptional regulator
MDKKQKLTLELRQDLYNKLNSHCKQTGKDQKLIIEHALKKYLDEYNDQKKKLEEFQKSRWR